METVKRVKLNCIANLITKGTTPTTLGYTFQDSGVNFLKIECFDDYGNFIKNKVTHISEECNKKLIRSQLQINDILFSIAGAIGRVAIVTEEMLPANTNQALAIIRIESKSVYLPYVKLILTSPIVKKQFEKKKQGVAQLNLSLKDIGELEIPLPDYKKQIEYVNLFDNVKRIVVNRMRELDKLDELVKARFVEMFNCCDLAEQKEDWKPISKIGTIISGSTPKTTIAEYWDGEYRWITPAEIDNEAGYIYDSQRKITLDGAKSCSLTELPIDTVLLTSRAPIGKVALAGNTFFCNQGFKNIVCNNRINPLFLYTLLRLNTDYLNSLGRGATFKEISKKIVENIKIPVPSMDLQNQFATFVKQIDKSKVAVKNALDKTQ